MPGQVPFGHAATGTGSTDFIAQTNHLRQAISSLCQIPAHHPVPDHIRPVEHLHRQVAGLACGLQGPLNLLMCAIEPAQPQAIDQADVVPRPALLIEPPIGRRRPGCAAPPPELVPTRVSDRPLPRPPARRGQIARPPRPSHPAPAPVRSRAARRRWLPGTAPTETARHPGAPGAQWIVAGPPPDRVPSASGPPPRGWHTHPPPSHPLSRNTPTRADHRRLPRSGGAAPHWTGGGACGRPPPPRDGGRAHARGAPPPPPGGG